MPRPWCVKLSDEDLAHAEQVADERFIYATGRSLADRYTDRGIDKSYEIHLAGARGEKAVSVKLDLPWNTVRGIHTHGSNVGGFKVRTRSEGWHELTLEPKFPPEDIYILVIGSECDFWLRGWYVAGDGLAQPTWQKDRGEFKGRFFVPNGALHAMERLPRRDVPLPPTEPVAAQLSFL